MSELKITYLDPSKLKPYARNAKLHTDEQVEKIAQQISNFGFDQPIVVTRRNVIIKGHGRHQAALKLGLEEVPVIVTNLTDQQAAAARIGDNKVAESPWLSDILKLEFLELKLDEMEIPKLTGFDLPEYKAIIENWAPPPPGTKSGEPEGEDQGLMARITVTCLQQNKERVLNALKAALKTNGIDDAKIT